MGATGVLTDDRAPTRRAAITHQEIIDLYATHHDALVRFAALMAPEDGMAEDLVQEAFVRLYKSWRKIREPEKVPAYLRSTVANLARGRGRRISTARKHQPAAAPDAASAEEGAMRSETQAEVVRLLRTLPDRQRQCLVLRYYEGQTESEIAATLGISIGSVRTHTSRGMAALGNHLGVTP
jgi:RNA polymerase sigma-70 factor (sigma-E family)